MKKEASTMYIIYYRNSIKLVFNNETYKYFYKYEILLRNELLH